MKPYLQSRLWPTGQVAGRETLPVTFLLYDGYSVKFELVTRPNPLRSDHLVALNLDTNPRRRGEKVKTNIDKMAILCKVHGTFLSDVKIPKKEKKKHTAMRDAASCAWVVCAADLLYDPTSA
jgi:hypothetical protein